MPPCDRGSPGSTLCPFRQRRLRLLLLLQLSQRPQFITANLMVAGCFLRVTCIVAARKSIASQVSSHISEARNPCRNGPDERDQVNVQLTERLDQHLGRGVVVADAGHDEVLALGRLLRFGALCRGTGQSIHLSTLAAVQAGECELFCSDSGPTKAQANNDRNAIPKRSVV